MMSAVERVLSKADPLLIAGLRKNMAHVEHVTHLALPLRKAV